MIARLHEILINKYTSNQTKRLLTKSKKFLQYVPNSMAYQLTFDKKIINVKLRAKTIAAILLKKLSVVLQIINILIITFKLCFLVSFSIHLI